MRFRKNGLCKILLVILFMAFISGGCGSGSSGVGGNSQGYNGNGNNGGQSGEINGTWEIVSGFGITSNDYSSGRREVRHLRYAGRNEPFEIEMLDNVYYDGRHYYTPRLKGKNVTMGAMLTVFCSYDEHPNLEGRMIFTTGSFQYTGNGTYRMSPEDDFDGNRANDNLINGEFIMKLEDENTIRWIEYGESNTDIDVGFSYTAYHYEIVLRRAGTSGNIPDNNTNNTAPNTNTNNNTNTNTSPTPNTNTNTNTQSDIPPQISGSWQITSGSGFKSQTVSGKVYTSHLTYSPQRNDKAFDIDITQNDSTTYYYGEHAGLFSLTLTGENIISSGVKGFGALRVYYSVAEAQGKETSFTFTGGKSFSYIGGGTYRLSVSNGTSYHEQTITLENESTILWKYTVPSDGWYEIVLTKAQ